MLILIDYDNVPRLDRDRGLQFVISRVLGSITYDRLPSLTRIRARLYGGWYAGMALSKAAQALSAQAQAMTGTPFGVLQGGRPISPTLSVELAYSLEVAPQVDLADTYRTRGAPPNLVCARPPYAACSTVGACALAATYALVSGGTCPASGCGVRLQDILAKAEQKLVDTMLTSDLIHLATRAATPIVVVSDDDDMWPGITTALAYGATVVHVHTQSGRTTPRHYAVTARGRDYHEFSF